MSTDADAPSILIETETGLDTLRFTNRFTNELPGDPDDTIRPRQVLESCWSAVEPKPTAAPTLIAHSPEMAAALGLDEATVASPAFAEVFSGNRLLPGMDVYAMCYGGHQFGNWAGQLGDGRAMALGEVRTPDGEHLTLQLKGAGPTPYSRTADGLAVLRSSVREFLCSEAMFHLGVPTTRALSLTLTGDQVLRDMLYNGNAAFEPGAVVCRVAPSFVRFGSFEIFSARDDLDTLRKLANHTIAHHFSHLLPSGVDEATLSADLSQVLAPGVYAAWFDEIAMSTADMIVDWMRVGFVHGVMNTDNLSILGLTIDYGPYGWLEDFDPGWTPNTTDAANKRYRYGAQPAIAQWNLARLANAIYPLIEQVEPLQEALDHYVDRYHTGWAQMMASRLGMANADGADDDQLFEDLITFLQTAEIDQTIFHRNLARVPLDDSADPTVVPAPLVEAFYLDAQRDDPAVIAALHAWLDRWRARVRLDGVDDAERVAAMDAVNPKYVLRNWLAQEAIDASEAGDHSMITELLDTLRTPYTDQPGREHFAERRPEWARTRVGCSMLSCSS